MQEAKTRSKPLPQVTYTNYLVKLLGYVLYVHNDSRG